MSRKPPFKKAPDINIEITGLLQKISNSISEREGIEAFFEEDSRYVDGVKKAIPNIEHALEQLKACLNEKPF